MAAVTSSAAQTPVAYGRSGYNNKPGEDDETKDQGRSGYNKGDKGDDEEGGDKQSLVFGH